MQGIRFYTVDLTRISGSGEFRCPKCGVEMSPEDETEEVYTILETVMKGDSLEMVVLRCNRCESLVHLVGFDLARDTVHVR